MQTGNLAAFRAPNGTRSHSSWGVMRFLKTLRTIKPEFAGGGYLDAQLRRFMPWQRLANNGCIGSDRARLEQAQGDGLDYRLKVCRPEDWGAQNLSAENCVRSHRRSTAASCR